MLIKSSKWVSYTWRVRSTTSNSKVATSPITSERSEQARAFAALMTSSGAYHRAVGLNPLQKQKNTPSPSDTSVKMPWSIHDHSRGTTQRVLSSCKAKCGRHAPVVHGQAQRRTQLQQRHRGAPEHRVPLTHRLGRWWARLLVGLTWRVGLLVDPSCEQLPRGQRRAMCGSVPRGHVALDERGHVNRRLVPSSTQHGIVPEENKETLLMPSARTPHAFITWPHPGQHISTPTFPYNHMPATTVTSETDVQEKNGRRKRGTRT